LYAQCNVENEECIAIDEWQFSLALGAGVITNPLHGGKNIPLILIPNFSYYGENFFIENSVLGYSFIEESHIAVSLISQVNRENAFFSRWHPSNIFVTERFNSAIGVSPPPSEDNGEEIEISLDDIEKRAWAIDGGLQINWFVTNKTDVKAQVLHDINSVYNGFNAQIEINHFLHFQQVDQAIVKLTLGGNWQSSEQVNYYYGIDTQDDSSGSALYQTTSSFSPYIKLFGHYQLTQQWAVRVNLSREFLSSSLTNSPLVSEDTLDTFFVGVTYVF